MQILTILATHRTELSLAEQVITQAWEHYSQNISEASLAAAVDATRCVIALHLQLASRLERLIGEAEPGEFSTDLLAHRTPSAA